MIIGGKASTKPLDVIESKKVAWQSYWCKNPDEMFCTFEAMAELEAEARSSNLLNINVAELDDSIHSIKDTTSLSLDAMPPRMLKRLPLVGREQLVSTLN